MSASSDRPVRRQEGKREPASRSPDGASRSDA
jgi:hypothetical protein